MKPVRCHPLPERYLRLAAGVSMAVLRGDVAPRTPIPPRPPIAIGEWVRFAGEGLFTLHLQPAGQVLTVSRDGPFPFAEIGYASGDVARYPLGLLFREDDLPSEED